MVWNRSYGLESKLRKQFPRPHQGPGLKVNLVRYADDFIITGSTRELLEEKVKPLVREHLSERGLELSEEKTHITHIEDGFDFLGQNVRKFKGVCLTRPSQNSIKSVLAKVRGIIKDHGSSAAGHLIVQLNPVIRGWANYHRHGASKKVFGTIDHHIFWALWQWARRRHPRKGSGWVRQKYFRTEGSNHWIFFGYVERKGKPPHRVRLTRAQETKIRRHICIRGAANPYDLAWETYFEEREGLKMEATVPGRRKLSYLWRQQKGRCPVCEQPISRVSGWEQHYRNGRTLGGRDYSPHRVLLHPHCHRKVHTLDPPSHHRVPDGALAGA